MSPLINVQMFASDEHLSALRIETQQITYNIQINHTLHAITASNLYFR